MAGELTISATMHRPYYESLPSPQQAYVLIEALPTAVAHASPQAVNFCLVLDRSGSMAGERMHRMKQAARMVVDRLGAQDMLSVVIFDERADVVVPAAPVQDRAAIQAQIERIEERGGTHMSSGMQTGFAELQRGMQQGGRVSRMLLLTDGQTWEDQPACEAIADQCRAAGVPLNVLGLGVGGEMTWDPRFLESLAQRSGGEWMIADTPDKVITIFEKTVQSMQATAVTNANMTVRFVEGVSPRAVWRVTPLISKLGHTAISERDVQIFLGDVEQGGQSLLADVLLPNRPAGTFRMMYADIRYDMPGSGLTGETARVDVLVNYTSDPAQVNQTVPKVMNLVERVTAHKLQTQALDEAAAGNFVNATRKLRAAATRLLDMGEMQMAQQANQQAQQLEQGGQIDAGAAQQMRYATKRLTETF